MKHLLRWLVGWMTAAPAKPVLRYATGERIEVGDVVSEPTNAGEVYGVVKEVFQRGDPAGMFIGPDGGITVAWNGDGYEFMANEIILGEDYIYFIRRK